MPKNIWIDAEWYINQKIFLIGYAYNTKECHQLYGKQLSRLHFKKILKPVKGFVYCYGPDIGMCEKYFSWAFRKKYQCINLIKAFRDHIKTGSFKLADLEKKFKIRRYEAKYKTSIFHIWRDWRNPTMKMVVLQYNRDDVINLVKLTNLVFKKYKIHPSYLKSIQLS